MLSHYFAPSCRTRRICSFQLRALTGYDEEFLVELESQHTPLSNRTIELLARTITLLCSKPAIPSLGTEKKEQEEIKNNKKNRRNGFSSNPSGNTKEAIRELAVGDRASLLLHLRKLMLGDKMQCEVMCTACREAMSLELTVSSLLQYAEDCPKEEYSAKIDGFDLKLRPVNGNDQEGMLLLSLEKNKPNTKDTTLEFADYIARNCIVSSTPTLPEYLSPEFIIQVSSKLEDIDPLAHIVLFMTCPSCNHCFKTTFLPEDYIFMEMFTGLAQLEQEIHLLAFYYHWSKKEIMSISTSERKRYVELILHAVQGEDKSI
jgi:hypothetical protein